MCEDGLTGMDSLSFGNVSIVQKEIQIRFVSYFS